MAFDRGDDGWVRQEKRHDIPPARSRCPMQGRLAVLVLLIYRRCDGVSSVLCRPAATAAAVVETRVVGRAD